MEPVADGFESLRTLLTAVWSGVGSVVSTIASRPLLLIPVGLLFCGWRNQSGKAPYGYARKTALIS